MSTLLANPLIIWTYLVVILGVGGMTVLTILGLSDNFGTPNAVADATADDSESAS